MIRFLPLLLVTTGKKGHLFVCMVWRQDVLTASKANRIFSAFLRFYYLFAMIKHGECSQIS